MTAAEASISLHAQRLFSRQMKEGDRLSRVVTCVGGCLILFPVQLLADVRSVHLALALVLLLVVTALSVAGSLLFFCLYYPDRRFWYMGIPSGLFTGPLISVVTVLCSAWCGGLGSVGIILAILMAGIPGYLLWYFRLKSVAIRRMERDIMLRVVRISPEPTPESHS